jgi:hypothetical protein
MNRIKESMRFALPRARHVLCTLAVAGLAASGCAMLGPTSIKQGRAAYSEAIVTSSNQQVLAMIVGIRYGEPSGLLAVSSVTANLNIQGNIGSEFGIGSDSSFEGNLTPLSAGIAYEENPTISYVPVEGEAYLRQLLSPLPIDLTILLLGAFGDNPQTMTLLCRSINGIQNPDFVTDPSVEADPRFARIVGLIVALKRAGRITWAQDAGKPDSFVMVLSGEGTLYGQHVGELYELLGFPVPRDIDEVITLPVKLGMGKPKSPEVRLRTRSLQELFNIAAASVEVPDEHVESGLAARLPPTGAAGKSIRIRRSQWRQRSAMVDVKRHGWWYSIDGTDGESKLTFRMIQALMSVRIAEASANKPSVLLTVPVSR